MFKLSEHYDQLVGMIIRPPRFIYNIEDLGPRKFNLGGRAVQRIDFELINSRKLTIQCSHFEPVEAWGRPLPCVIYLHGNGGGRLDALDTVRALLPCGISVIALDLTGSGLSDGEYVSLGYWEKEDVAAVVAYLRETGRVTTVGLWGRSMGAVTALLYSRIDPTVAAMVLDSPFCSLSRVAEELVCSMPIATLQRLPRLTRLAVGLGLRAIRSSIKKKAKFDVRSLELLDMVNECFIPALFVHGEGDTFVRPAHSEELYTRYGGDKNRVVVEGDHNSMRPPFFMDSAIIFFTNTLYAGEPPPPPSSVPRPLGFKLSSSASCGSLTSGVASISSLTLLNNNILPQDHLPMWEQTTPRSDHLSEGTHTHLSEANISHMSDLMNLSENTHSCADLELSAEEVELIMEDVIAAENAAKAAAVAAAAAPPVVETTAVSSN